MQKHKMIVSNSIYQEI